jgi:radical SAM protein with 4Fe4S-binding SPASM domain
MASKTVSATALLPVTARWQLRALRTEQPSAPFSAEGLCVAHKCLAIALVTAFCESEEVQCLYIFPNHGPLVEIASFGKQYARLLRLAEAVFHSCSAGRGFVYIKPDGDVWPCPFIEMSCGNVRETPFRRIWKKPPAFEDLRHRETRLKGRCGECEYRRLCGGCRGRTWALTGDYLKEDPSCFIHAGDAQEGVR